MEAGLIFDTLGNTKKCGFAFVCFLIERYLPIKTVVWKNIYFDRFRNVIYKRIGCRIKSTSRIT